MADTFKCPKCGSKVVPMKSGKGFRCAQPGNRWVKSKWTLCDGVIWNNKTASRFVRKVVERAYSFPVIVNPTDEQGEIFKLFALAPQARGGRAIIVNAGPGTAKTTTASWSLQAAYARLGDLSGFAILAFNVNAKDVLLTKLPVAVPDVFTLNGYGARAQGYQFKQFEAGKIRRLYKEATEHVSKEHRLPPGIIPKIIERSRDLCLFAANEGDKDAWQEIVIATLERFPGLQKRYDGNEKFVAEYLPGLAVAAHRAAGTIDIQEQITRPVTEAIYRTGWKIDSSLVQLGAKWTDEDVRHFAGLIRSIKVPQAKGLVIDEAQDLSLCQIAVFLAQVWRSGELVLIGDDKAGEPGEDGYKAGQAIYGWRGAFGGSMDLVSRLWFELTGERTINRQLSITFRCAPEIVDALQPLNTVLRSSRDRGHGRALSCTVDQAWNAWLALPEGQTALWITRTNAPLAPLFLDSIRNHAECCLRGGSDFASNVDNTIAQVAGWADANGDYGVELNEAIEGLKQVADENEQDAGEADPNSLERFICEIASALVADNSLLARAELNEELTLGNVRRFILYFADKSARRTLSTVYRCKGDEADLVVVGDVEKFNETWNGDADEAAAVRHVAASRARDTLLVCGSLAGVNTAQLASTIEG